MTESVEWHTVTRKIYLYRLDESFQVRRYRYFP